MDAELAIDMDEVRLCRALRDVEFLLDEGQAASLCQKPGHFGLAGREAVGVGQKGKRIVVRWIVRRCAAVRADGPVPRIGQGVGFRQGAGVGFGRGFGAGAGRGVGFAQGAGVGRGVIPLRLRACRSIGFRSGRYEAPRRFRGLSG